MNLYLAGILNQETVNHLPHTSANNLSSILNIVFSVMGALALFMLVIAGLRYVLAGGDSNKVTEAKRQIAYTLVGLVVILLAAGIVNFVLNRA